MKNDEKFITVAAECADCAKRIPFLFQSHAVIRDYTRTIRIAAFNIDGLSNSNTLCCLVRWTELECARSAT